MRQLCYNIVPGEGSQLTAFVGQNFMKEAISMFWSRRVVGISEYERTIADSSQTEYCSTFPCVSVSDH